MNGVDAIIFTAGVGENDIAMRDIICNDLGNLGIKLDVVKNKVRGKEMIISREDSKVKVLLIPTNEELMIARDTFNIVTKDRHGLRILPLVKIEVDKYYQERYTLEVANKITGICDFW